MNPYKKNQTLFNIAKEKAKKLNVEIRPSNKKYKKLDVITKDKIISIGDTRYDDFNIHKDEKRRANYKARHQKFRTKKGSASYFADKILW